MIFFIIFIMVSAVALFGALILWEVRKAEASKNKEAGEAADKTEALDWTHLNIDV